MTRLLLFFLSVFTVETCFASDSAMVLTENKFIGLINNHHPITKQADIVQQKAEKDLLRSRGSFDPYIYGKFKEKDFKDNEYFNLLGAGLKVPTWFGIEVDAGYEQNQGIYLNPENNVPDNGLIHAGVSIPLGKGLFMDKRRATLRKAKIYAQASIQERKQIINDLYFDALKKYWRWVEVWNEYEVYKESVELARDRLLGVRRSFQVGDKPAIDTLEAFIQLQTRLYNRNEKYLLYQNATLELSNFLWLDGHIPLEITDSLKPPEFKDIVLKEIIPPDSIETLLINIETTHPEMLMYRYKISAAKIDERLKIEGLKPKANINYNALTEPAGSETIDGFFNNDYKWGIEFGIPIFLREQRGDLSLVRLKIQDIELSASQKLLMLQNKLKSYYNEETTLKQQVQLYAEIVFNYSELLSGEKRKFFGGESSLFLINSRETNLISAQLKDIELTAKYQKANLGVLWSAGILYDFYSKEID